jgi:hypothetical protein
MPLLERLSGRLNTLKAFEKIPNKLHLLCGSLCYTRPHVFVLCCVFFLHSGV